MRFIIKSTDVEILKGISKRTQKPYEMHIQTAFWHHDDEVKKVRVTLRTGQLPYAPGNYTLSPASFSVNNFGDLELRVALLPLAADIKKVG